jgi:hypothetical protein
MTNMPRGFLAWLWRAAIPLVWLLSVAAALRGGFQRGLEPRELIGRPAPYPWLGVSIVSLVTAVELGIIYLILRPPTFRWSVNRAAIALGVSVLLSGLHIATTVTDVPGFVYVPAAFSLLTTALLLLLFLVTLTVSLISRRTRSVPPGGHAA